MTKRPKRLMATTLGVTATRRALLWTMKRLVDKLKALNADGDMRRGGLIPPGNDVKIRTPECCEFSEETRHYYGAKMLEAINKRNVKL